MENKDLSEFKQKRNIMPNSFHKTSNKKIEDENNQN